MLNGIYYKIVCMLEMGTVFMDQKQSYIPRVFGIESNLKIVITKNMR